MKPQVPEEPAERRETDAPREGFTKQEKRIGSSTGSYWTWGLQEMAYIQVKTE